MSAKFMPHQPPSTEVRPNLEEIKSTLQRIMPEIRSDTRVLYLGVFGSYVRGEANQASDLDLLVEFEQALPPSTSSYAWKDISASEWASR